MVPCVFQGSATIYNGPDSVLRAQRLLYAGFETEFWWFSNVIIINIFQGGGQ
jgi:hypothetical protein